jgi:hypothetical protein
LKQQKPNDSFNEMVLQEDRKDFKVSNKRQKITFHVNGVVEKETTQTQEGNTFKDSIDDSTLNRDRKLIPPHSRNHEVFNELIQQEDFLEKRQLGENESPSSAQSNSGSLNTEIFKNDIIRYSKGSTYAARLNGIGSQSSKIITKRHLGETLNPEASNLNDNTDRKINDPSKDLQIPNENVEKKESFNCDSDSSVYSEFSKENKAPDDDTLDETKKGIKIEKRNDVSHQYFYHPRHQHQPASHYSQANFRGDYGPPPQPTIFIASGFEPKLSDYEQSTLHSRFRESFKGHEYPFPPIVSQHVQTPVENSEVSLTHSESSETLISQIKKRSNNNVSIKEKSAPIDVSDSDVLDGPVLTSDFSHDSKRRSFPQPIKRLLKRWLLKNNENPYPSLRIKISLAEKTGLKVSQVEDFLVNGKVLFIVGRQRYIRPKRVGESKV